jgi:hypothetical protein
MPKGQIGRAPCVIEGCDRLAEDSEFLEPLRGKRLACWCRPPEGFNGRLLCHGQVIAGLLDGVAPEMVE